jgi:hypothetical protein
MTRVERIAVHFSRVSKKRNNSSFLLIPKAHTDGTKIWCWRQANEEVISVALLPDGFTSLFFSPHRHEPHHDIGRGSRGLAANDGLWTREQSRHWTLKQSRTEEHEGEEKKPRGTGTQTILRTLNRRNSPNLHGKRKEGRFVAIDRREINGCQPGRCSEHLFQANIHGRETKRLTSTVRHYPPCIGLRTICSVTGGQKLDTWSVDSSHKKRKCWK